ncbi:DUF6622 family protein [Neptuniibacter caesariensis]|uniref:Probable transmembrane protein n=1 Tax=Neptuniibacter caesariensis TaxID=207954 RepID=A0A7U8GQV9_NEPCE|nr:DUF6622 family protein [Neptuniibacter caesariensis]EAR59557.1 probable transmembrane protein [Oceanospirillum sp. MED92] [Neptuniibacter caesariensis]
MSEIIQNTPVWVFLIFGVLVVLGLFQAKTREVSVKAIFVLPLAMIIFSLFGVYSVFGLKLAVICLWGLGLSIMTLIGVKLGFPKSVAYSQERNKLIIVGSWTPLLFMMAIFFTRYFVGFATARELPIIHEMYFALAIGLAYGAFTGVFLSRSLVMFKAYKQAACLRVTS